MAEQITVNMIRAKVAYINSHLAKTGKDWRIGMDTRTGGRIVGLTMDYADNPDRTMRDLRYGPKAELFAYLCGMMDMIRD